VTTKAGTCMTVVYGTCIFRKAILLQESVVAVTGRSLEKQMDAQHKIKFTMFLVLHAVIVVRFIFL